MVLHTPGPPFRDVLGLEGRGARQWSRYRARARGIVMTGDDSALDQDDGVLGLAVLILKLYSKYSAAYTRNP